ncbi:MAG: chorismate mutase [Elusimicrobiota bacterium]
MYYSGNAGFRAARTGIDRIDKRVIGLIGRRDELVKIASKHKHNIKQAAANTRVREIMRTRTCWAKETGVNPALVRNIYKRMISYFVTIEKAELTKRDKAMYYSKDRLKLRKDVTGAAMWAVALDNAMLTYFELKPFTVFRKHSHVCEQITCVLEGELYFKTAEGTVTVRKGEAIAIPSNVPHSVFCRDKFVKAVDAWSPVMEKYAELETEEQNEYAGDQSH